MPRKSRRTSEKLQDLASIGAQELNPESVYDTDAASQQRAYEMAGQQPQQGGGLGGGVAELAKLPPQMLIQLLMSLLSKHQQQPGQEVMGGSFGATPGATGVDPRMIGD